MSWICAVHGGVCVAPRVLPAFEIQILTCCHVYVRACEAFLTLAPEIKVETIAGAHAHLCRKPKGSRP